MNLIIEIVFATIIIAPCVAIVIGIVFPNISEHFSTSNL